MRSSGAGRRWPVLSPEWPKLNLGVPQFEVPAAYAELTHLPDCREMQALLNVEAKMHFARFISSAALLLLTFSFVAPVHAQNNKPITSGTFYEDRASASNTNSSLFTLTFAQSPTNKLLNITNVSCSATVSSDQTISLITLFVGTASGQNDLGRPYSIKGSATPETIGPYKFYSIVTNQIYYKMGFGRYPTIQIGTLSTNSYSTDASCVIVGNLTDN
jgi:hypothetical protein